MRGGCWDAGQAIELVADVLVGYQMGALSPEEALREIEQVLLDNNFGELLGEGPEEVPSPEPAPAPKAREVRLGLEDIIRVYHNPDLEARAVAAIRARWDRENGVERVTGAKECPTCNGWGRIGDDILCPRCDGTGRGE